MPAPFESKEFAGQWTEALDRIGMQEHRRSRVPARLSNSGQQVTDWNDVQAVGFYWGDGAANAPFPGKVMAVAKSDGSRLVVEASDPANLITRSAVRVLSGSSWAAWVIDDRRPAFLLGNDKGSTVVPHNEWTFLNTASASGNNFRNDGFTYGLGRILVPKPGIYDLDISVRFGQTASGEARLVRVFPDDLSAAAGNVWLRNTAWAAQQQVLSLSAKVMVDTHIKVQVYQNSGANMSVLLDNIALEWRGPK